MIHPTFDVQKWQNCFDWEAFAINELLDGWNITSPVHLLGSLYGREKSKIDISRFKTQETDVFVMGYGEPLVPYQTKIGGCPFRPREKNWPNSSAGKPLVFAAQFCFLDSLDIVGCLPGNLLLIFFDEYPPVTKNTEFFFEWYDIDDIREVQPLSSIASQAFLRAGWKYDEICCYGVKLRTVDYVEGYRAFSSFYRADSVARNLHSLRATKIGGLPSYYGATYDDYHGDYITSDYMDENTKRHIAALHDAQFLCSIASIEPAISAVYPFVNRETPIPCNDIGHYSLLWGDLGALDIYIDKEKSILWDFRDA